MACTSKTQEGKTIQKQKIGKVITTWPFSPEIGGPANIGEDRRRGSVSAESQVGLKLERVKGTSQEKVQTVRKLMIRAYNGEVWRVREWRVANEL